MPCTQILEATDDSDHLPLLATIEVGKVGFIPPLDIEEQPAEAITAPKFVQPIKPSQLLELQARFEDLKGLEIHALDSHLESVLSTISAATHGWLPPRNLDACNKFHADRTAAVKAQGISSGTIEDIDSRLQALLASALELSYQILDTTQPKPDKRYLCRKDTRRLRRLIEQGKRARAEFESGGRDPIQRQELHVLLNKLRQERHALTKDIRIANAKLRQLNFQDLLSKKPKVAHGILNGKIKDKIDPTILREQGTDRILYRSTDVLKETHTFFQTLNQAPHEQKQCHSSPNLAYPWHLEDALDPFRIETHVRREGFGFIDLEDHIKNPALFQRCLRGTKSGKAPGPDGICNEILRCLPESMQQSIHKFFILIWLTGHTPRSWKQSQTILIYKKGDPLQLSNYRPIALANTLYKIWTGMLTQAMSTYAEHFHLLADCQEGFRKHRNTMRALQTTLNVYEDAKFHKKNVFALYTDYSNAFNTIDQQRLLQILRDLNFPDAAVDAVKDIYSEAATTIKTPAGVTESIPVQRGVLQGDTLSTFLFNCFMEPLARWLQSGGRGYAYGCLEASKASQNLQIKMSHPML